jgi:hypothetical protein
VRALDASDSKLRLISEGPMAGANYLVRTVNLVRGQKNVLEVYVDGVRTTRTKKPSGSPSEMYAKTSLVPEKYRSR